MVGGQKRNRLLSPPYQPWPVADQDILIAHLAYPGILMRPEGKEWKREHVEEHVPALRAAMSKSDLRPQ